MDWSISGRPERLCAPRESAGFAALKFAHNAQVRNTLGKYGLDGLQQSLSSIGVSSSRQGDGDELRSIAPNPAALQLAHLGYVNCGGRTRTQL